MDAENREEARVSFCHTVKKKKKNYSPRDDNSPHCNRLMVSNKLKTITGSLNCSTPLLSNCWGLNVCVCVLGGAYSREDGDIQRPKSDVQTV